MSASPAYEPYVPTCFTCSRALRASVPLLCTCLHFFLRALRALRAFIFYVPYVLSFFYVPHVPSVFLCVLHSFSFLRVSRALVFYVPYMSSFLRALRAFIFLRAYILFMYMLIKLTQINKINYDCSCLLLLNSVIYQRLSSIFTSRKLLSCSAWFLVF